MIKKRKKIVWYRVLINPFICSFFVKYELFLLRFYFSKLMRILINLNLIKKIIQTQSIKWIIYLQFI